VWMHDFAVSSQGLAIVCERDDALPTHSVEA
jgi:hypothetical protein